MNDQEQKDTQWERAEAETGTGTKIAFGMLPVYAGLAALAMLLFMVFPAHWVALSLVVIALVTAGMILSRGLQRPRRRG
jgi:hypothetical protein